jgi:ATP-dependent Clp protease ATP-binding subunit ClpB
MDGNTCINTLGINERSELIKLGDSLSKKVIGQEEAVEAVSSAIKRARRGISDIGQDRGRHFFFSAYWL